MIKQLSRRAFLAATAAATVAGPRVAAADDLEDPVYQRASVLTKQLADGKISARELLESAVARIDQIDGKINAVVVRDFDRARRAAADADAAIARGERKPLLGVPMTVKEQFNVAGLPTTWGHPEFKAWKPEIDALVVERLKTAGAIIIGKTNVPLDLGDWQSFNEVYGTTNNPWDLARTPGGSSGGAAAALAAGFVPLELGSDIGGSLRAPAHFCGVYSHKPSLDLVPQRGSGPPKTPAIPVRGDLSVIGPMARSADDLALLMSVVAGPDEEWEGIGYKLTLPPPRHDRLGDFRVLLIDKHPMCPTAASIAGALDMLAERLGKAGCPILRSSPKVPDLARTTRNYAELLLAFFSANLPPMDQVAAEAAARSLAPDDLSLQAARLHGLAISHPAWIKSSRIRGMLRANWQALFRDVDIVLCPPMPTTAFAHDRSKPSYKRQLEIDGRKIPYDDQIAWAGIATLTGLPATVAPIGRDERGLPIGVQIIGGFLEDRTTIRFAELMEREFGGFQPPPSF